MTFSTLIFFLFFIRSSAEQKQCAGDTCSDQAVLLQNRVNVASMDSKDQAKYEETDPRKVQHFTTLEVDMTTTKLLAGVPVYNYHMIHAGGMNPSELELSEGKSWLINFPASFSDADIHAFCDPATLPGNSRCNFEGHPTEGAISFAEFVGTEEELTQAIRDHDTLRPLFMEGNLPVTAIPDVKDGPELIQGEQEPTAVGSWGIDRLDDRMGLDLSYATPPASTSGEGAHVYIADTGIRFTHSDLEGRAIPAIEALPDTSEAGGVKECAAGDTTCAFDRNGHGTHCAGTVGGKTFGVANKVALYSAKVLSDAGSGSFSGIIKSVDWVIQKGNKPAVWSASLGGAGVMHSIENTFATAKTHGVTIVVAAGNDNSDACNFSPAFAPSAITVGSTTRSNARSSFSNYGSCVDIFAPGTTIVSASHSSDGGSSTLSGTSMACPHVAGVVAVLLGDNPTFTGATGAQQVEDYMKAWSTPSVVTDAKGPNYLLHVPDQVGGDAPTHPPTTTTTTAAVPADQRLIWSLSSGSCVVEATTDCITSPNYPQAYGNNERCNIAVSQPGMLRVEHFDTERGWDKLNIDGQDYHGSGSQGPSADMVVRSSMVWESDGSVVKTGFKVCPKAENVAPTQAPTQAPTHAPTQAPTHAPTQLCTRDDTRSLLYAIGAGALGLLVGIALGAAIVGLGVTAAHCTGVKKSPVRAANLSQAAMTSNPMRTSPKPTSVEMGPVVHATTASRNTHTHTHTKAVNPWGSTFYTNVATLESTREHPGEHAIIIHDHVALSNATAPATMITNPMAAANFSERRLASDGTPYTKAEFISHYNGTNEWDAAPSDKRVAPDGTSYTKVEFIAHYGGSKEWDAAPGSARFIESS